MRSGWSSWTQRAVALAIGVLAVLVFLEVGLRLVARAYWREPAVEDPLLLDHLDEACPGCRRVLCLGDSYTYGMGASEGMDYPSQLERRLNEGLARPGFQVINGGVGTANSTMVRETLEQYLRRFRPDLVTVLVGGANYWQYYGLPEFLGTRAGLRGLLARLQVLASVRLVGHALHSRRSPEPAGQPLADSVPLTLRWLEAHGQGLSEMERSAPALHRGLVLLEAGLPLHALEVLEQAAREHPADVRAHWAVGAALRRLRRNEAAWARHEAAIAVDPSHPAPYHALGELCYDLGVFGEERTRWFRRAIEVAPDFGPAHCMLGDSLLGPRGGDPAEAMALLWRGIALEPLASSCYPALVGWYRQQGDLRELRRELRRRDLSGPLVEAHVVGLGEDPSAEEREAWLRHDLGRMADLLEAEGVPLLLFQYLTSVEANAPIAEAARRGDIPLVETAAAFQRLVVEGVTLGEVFLPDNHYSDRGNAIFAGLVLDAVRRELEEPRPVSAAGEAAPLP